MKRRILFVLGTRPEVIKLAPVILRFRESDQLDVRICSTGQHREMLRQTLEVFGLEPDFELDVMTENQTLAGLTSRAVSALDDVFAAERPDFVFVQGDTTTAMAGALAAFYRGIPIAHVEAGLRTSNKLSPFPEEMNRRLIGSIADVHFAPTPTARDNLLREGVTAENIVVTGNTAIDALLLTVRRGTESVQLTDLGGNTVTESEFAGRRMVLVTAHRRENHKEGIAAICNALLQIAKLPEAIVVFPVHYNPNVRDIVLPILSGRVNIVLTDPLDYKTFARLLSCAYMILTDSGGIQEEAPSLGRPVLVLRDTTERPEGIAAGNAQLVGTGTAEIVHAVEILWKDSTLYQRMSEASNPYGDGQAAERIYATLASRT